jgi:OmpA-OmpF porin, OOP family
MKGIPMRIISLAVALASTALSGAAIAKDDFWYTSLKGGASLVEGFTQYNGVPIAKIGSKTGYTAAGEVGYDFGSFRTGFELGYQSAGVSDIGNLTNLAIIGTNGVNNVTRGKTNVLSFMLNGLFDFGGEGGWGGHAGGGIGIAQVKAKNYATGTKAAFLNDSHSGLAFQGLAGVTKAISDNVDLTFDYRYFHAPKVRLIASNGNTFRSTFKSHSLMAGFAYNFGGAEAPAAVAAVPVAAAVAAAPEPTPAPMPEPVAAPAPVAPGPFIIFFDWDKSVITPEAGSILTAAAQAYKDTGQAKVSLSGFADRSGTDSYNDALSARRSAAAKAFMIGQGVPADVIATTSFGETKPLVETADGVREPQNRRVEITF